MIETELDSQLDSYKKHLAKVCLRLRAERHLSQDGLAKELQLARSTVQKLEKGTTNPSFDTLLSICKLKGLPYQYVDRLLGMKDFIALNL